MSSMLIPLRSASPVLVMISSMSVPICNRFHARQANSEYPSLTPACDGVVEPSRLGLWTLTVKINIKQKYCSTADWMQTALFQQNYESKKDAGLYIFQRLVQKNLGMEVF